MIFSKRRFFKAQSSHSSPLISQFTLMPPSRASSIRSIISGFCSENPNSSESPVTAMKTDTREQIETALRAFSGSDLRAVSTGLGFSDYRIPKLVVTCSATASNFNSEISDFRNTYIGKSTDYKAVIYPFDRTYSHLRPLQTHLLRSRVLSRELVRPGTQTPGWQPVL